MLRKNIKTPAVIAGVILALAAAGVLAARFISPVLVRMSVLPNTKVVDFHTYFSLDVSTPGLIWEDTRLTGGESPYVQDDVVYLPVSVARNMMDPFLFWDTYAGAAVYARRRFFLGQRRFLPAGGAGAF